MGKLTKKPPPPRPQRPRGGHSKNDTGPSTSPIHTASSRRIIMRPEIVSPLLRPPREMQAEFSPTTRAGQEFRGGEETLNASNLDSPRMVSRISRIEIQPEVGWGLLDDSDGESEDEDTSLDGLRDDDAERISSSGSRTSVSDQFSARPGAYTIMNRSHGALQLLGRRHLRPRIYRCSLCVATNSAHGMVHLVRKEGTEKEVGEDDEECAAHKTAYEYLCWECGVCGSRSTGDVGVGEDEWGKCFWCGEDGCRGNWLEWREM